MNQSNQSDDDLPTLDPPGTIAVVGAGPLGIEAALYGRFLGYDVTIVEAFEVGHGVTADADAPLPVLPNRCLSPLAMAANQAQEEDSAPRTLPLTLSQWIHEALIPLTETDLLRGRLLVPWRVSQIETVPIEFEEDDDPDAIPPDFRLTLVGTDGQSASLDSEAVIVAVGNSLPITLGFSLPAPYFFRIGANPPDDWEQSLLLGYREIVEIYSQLAGRADLDLYRPKRV